MGDYYVALSSNSPVVRGGTVKFKAQLYEDDSPATGWYQYEWTDNSLPDHYRKVCCFCSLLLFIHNF